jgi:TPR repeat protein
MAVLVAIILLATPARSDFAAAARAYDGGDYATAFALWHTLARQGDAAAQIAIAGLYSDGAGRPVDPVQAARWYRRAAQQGDAVAQMNLGEMYERGRGVPRDAVEAFVWYDRAARQGRSWAAEQRDNLARTMQAKALETAKKRLRADR